MKPIGEAMNSMLAGLEQRMKAQAGRHSWGDPVRPDMNNTFRTCCKCGIVKITRHEPQNTPRHWVEWERDGMRIVTAGTPRCEDGIKIEAVEQEEAA